MRITHANIIKAGAASKGNLTDGVDMAQMVLVRWGTGSRHNRAAPALAVVNNICTSQTILSATTSLINGALATSGVATLDVPRNIQFVSSNAGDTTQVATIRGFDEYGEAVTETKTANGTTPVVSLKAYKTINSITWSAALAGNLTVGTHSRLGLPFRMRVGDLITVKADNAVEVPTTITVADTATPTAATGDIRGTVLPSTAMNGTVQFSMLFWIQDNGVDAVGGELGQYKA